MSDIKLSGPKDCADSLSFDGQTYIADKKGIFTVPEEAYGPFIAQGFTAVGDAADVVVAS
jgi:hypothetical protein